MPPNMRHLFSKSKGSSAPSPDSGASVSASAVCSCGCLIHGQGAGITAPAAEGQPVSTPCDTPPHAAEGEPASTPCDTPPPSDIPLTAPPPSDTPLTIPPPSETPLTIPASAAASLAASAPAPVELDKSHPKIDNILKGTSITLSVLEGVGAVAPVPFLKDIAQVTKTFVKLIQTILQNNELLRELIQDAIALGQCVIDAINACFTPGEPLPDVFEQHVRVLLDTLTEAKDMCFDVLRECRAKKPINAEANKDKIEKYRRRIKAGLDHFQLRSNISVEAHFAKWSKFLEERFPLNGFVPKQPQQAPVQNVTNVDNSQTHITNAPTNKHTFNCMGGTQSGLGNQINILPGAGPSNGQQFDMLEFQKMVLKSIGAAQLNVPALPAPPAPA